jgi:hypothetical protein
MYGGGMAALEDQKKREEEHLLGKPVELTSAEDVTRVERTTQLVSLAAAPPQSQNENWQRLNNDPLFMIKQQEQEQLKRVRASSLPCWLAAPTPSCSAVPGRV